MRKWASLTVVAALAARAPGLTEGLVDYDTWRQTDTATIARNFLEDPRILWPRIDWGAPGPGFVEAEFQLFPFTVSLLYRAFGEDPLYGRLLSLLLTGLACLVFHRLAQRFLGDGAALGALVFFAMAPLVYRYSRVFMPEATALLFYLAALERFLAFLDDRRWTSVLASGGAMAMAILVKPTTIHLGLALMILASSRFGPRTLVSARLLAFGAVALLPAVAYYSHAAAIHMTYGNTFGVISGGDSKWGGPAYWYSPRFWAFLAYADVGWAAGPGAAALAILGFVANRGDLWRTLGGSWAMTLLLYYLVVARYAGDPRGLQYHVYAAPLIALMAGGGFESLLRKAGKKARWAGPALVVLVLALQAIPIARLFRQKGGLLFRDAGIKLAELSSPGDLVLVLSSDVAFEDGVPNNFEQPDVFFHARRRGRVLATDRQTGRALAEALGSGTRWFVNFPGQNSSADASFREMLDLRTRVVVAAPGYELRAITPP